MANYDPAHLGSAWDDNGGYEVTDGNNQEHMQHSSDQVQAEYSLDPAQHASGDLPSPDGATGEVGEYDPTAAVAAAPAAGAAAQPAADQVPLRPSPQRAAKQKPRTAGGFLVGDSDSEDDETPVAASSGRAPGAASQSSASRSPLQHSITAKQATVVPSNAELAAQVNTAAPAGPPENGNTAAPSAPEAAAPPPVAVDRIAQLEDRIRSDPRGAMDAWLALIAEHRAKNDIEQSRQVYERFLAVFPQAVSVNFLRCGVT
jgi:cleavage stimulation factor subunit 3